MRNLFLIGYRGTGKSTVARIVAERLGWTCADMDELLEQRCGRTIRSLFAEEGEAGFRDREAALLEELARSGRCVIATGGGVILRPANRQRLLEAGRTVWLIADPQTVWARLQTDPATADRRPTLTVGGLAEIEELLRIREPLYSACADAAVDTQGRTVEAVVKSVLDFVFSYGPRSVNE